jgi:FkbM family methyltransferase
MISVTYSSEGIKVEVGSVKKYNPNQPFILKINKHVSGETQWETNLSDGWFATFPSTEMYDVVLVDSKNNVLYSKKWDVMENGNHFYKSLWFYNKSILAQGRVPSGLVIGTHDGEFGEWVPIVLRKECNVLLVEASDKQHQKLTKNYKNNSSVKIIQDLITPDGGDVEFFEGGEGYTNTVVEKVIRHWEKQEIHSTKKSSTSITDLILSQFNGKLDWLHLDVEGLDAKLIMSIDENKIKLPNFIIFEDYNLSDDEKSQIYTWLKNRQYGIFSDSGICEAVR